MDDSQEVGMRMTGGVIILGGGPAGMASAYEMHRAGRDFRIIEKNKSVGGLARTMQFGEFKTDIGPHRFYSQNRYLYEMIEGLLGEHWIRVDRMTRFYINGKFFNYPVEISNALRNVGPYKAFRIIMDFAIERLKPLFSKKDLISFEDLIVADFGRTLAELNMLNYTEKIWGLPCSEISPDWASQRIRGLSLRAIIQNMINKSKKGPKTLVDEFYYPDSGTGMIYESIKERISKGGKEIVITGSEPLSINIQGDAIASVEVKTSDGIKTFNPDFVISTIPLTLLAGLIRPGAPDSVKEAVISLKFRSHVSLFITLNRSSVFPDQWIYFPDRDLPFSRIMEPRNFSRLMSPEGKTSLLVEFFCWHGDEVWNADKNTLTDDTVKRLSTMGLISETDLMESFMHKERYAYPVYDLEYSERLAEIKGWLRGVKNLQLAGRGGAFRYNNQDHALEMGILAARNIIDNANYDLEEVGAGRGYFESGISPQT